MSYEQTLAEAIYTTQTSRRELGKAFNTVLLQPISNALLRTGESYSFSVLPLSGLYSCFSSLPPSLPSSFPLFLPLSLTLSLPPFPSLSLSPSFSSSLSSDHYANGMTMKELLETYYIHVNPLQAQFFLSLPMSSSSSCPGALADIVLMSSTRRMCRLLVECGSNVTTPTINVTG